jgi:hypothetical protein
VRYVASRPPSSAQCNIVPEQQRLPCGGRHLNVYRHACQRAGCCWDNTTNSETPFNSTRCFVGAPFDRAAAHCQGFDKHCGNFARCSACGKAKVVPNIVHYVWGGSGCPPWQAIISLISVALVQQPESITLWVEESADSVCNFTTDRAGSCWGAFGAQLRVMPTSDLARLVPNLNVSRLLPAHRSDLMRLHVLSELGGIYLDSDAFVVHNLSRWRHCATALGTDPGFAKLNNGVILAAKGAIFLKHWLKAIEEWDGESWDVHSCIWPFVHCRSAPDLVAATSRLGTIASPSFHNGAGEKMSIGSMDEADVVAYIEQQRDVFHLTGSSSWGQVLGTQWEKIGVPPCNGSEIINPKLATALKRTIYFTVDELKVLELEDLQVTDFIKAGTSFFQPVRIGPAYSLAMKYLHADHLQAHPWVRLQWMVDFVLRNAISLAGGASALSAAQQQCLREAQTAALDSRVYVDAFLASRPALYRRNNSRLNAEPT